MRFHLSFDMDNAAFDEEQGGPAAEVHRLLRRLAVRVQREPLVPGEGGPIHDSNGATVGQWFVAGETHP